MNNNSSADFFKQKQAFITGGSRGIGRAIALALAARGCDILLHFRKNREEADKTRADLEALGVKVWLYQADLCEEAETQKMFQKILSEHKHLDFFVANAASTAFKGLMDLTSTNIDKTFALVVKHFLVGVQKLKPLLAGHDGRIVTISGIDTVKYCPGHGLLAAAKSALETLSKYLSVELAGEKIHVKCLNPGLVATDSTRFYLGDNFDAICTSANQIAPQGGFALPEKIAEMVLFLLSPESDWMAAQTVYADGGLSFMLPVLTR